MNKLRLTLACWDYDRRTRIFPILRYHHEQGLSPRLLAPAQLFAPETLENYVI